MKKFFIIDGSGFLYRAYYAFPEMLNEKWENYNVIFWFFRMMLKIFAEKPDYFVIARDAPTKTHRHEIYPEYKANRTKAPDDFKVQIPVIQDIVTKLKIPSLVMPWYEADDIIAACANNYKNNENIVSYIYSSDKDLKQLLDKDNNVFIFDAMKWTKTTTKEFLQEYMFEPKYILDYLSLVWDGADNIKWVPGIGPKWASELIIKYQTIENVYDHINELSPWMQNKLIEWKESAFHSKKLIELEEVPELDNLNLEEFNLDIDFPDYKKVLIEEYWLKGINKTLDELKNKYYMPTQDSLF